MVILKVILKFCNCVLIKIEKRRTGCYCSFKEKKLRSNRLYLINVKRKLYIQFK